MTTADDRARIEEIEKYLGQKTGDPWRRSSTLEGHADWLLSRLSAALNVVEAAKLSCQVDEELEKAVSAYESEKP